MATVKDLMGSGIPALPATTTGRVSYLMVISPSPKHQLALLSNSADAADSYRLDIAAGGAIADQTRGAFITMSGVTKNAATGFIDLGAVILPHQ